MDSIIAVLNSYGKGGSQKITKGFMTPYYEAFYGHTAAFDALLSHRNIAYEGPELGPVPFYTDYGAGTAAGCLYCHDA
jgi:hypothetical protein